MLLGAWLCERCELLHSGSQRARSVLLPLISARKAGSNLEGAVEGVGLARPALSLRRSVRPFDRLIIQFALNRALEVATLRYMLV